MTLAAYLPIDRYQAIARQQALPDRTVGSALFADIASFTPLAEALANELGASYGAETLSKHLNNLYQAIIAEVEAYHGSVVYFSGDAITCWFDGDERTTTRRAVTSALAMQEVMQKVARVTTPAGYSYQLALKVTVTSGSVRRFRVGNPEIQYLDVLAGSTIERLAKAEKFAKRNEILIAPEVFELLGEELQISETRYDEKTGMCFAVVTDLYNRAPTEGWNEISENAVPAAVTRQWVLPFINDLYSSGFNNFMTELRPANPVFVQFEGIDYEQDEKAGEKLDAFIRWVQEIVTNYGGNLLSLTIGDKGSYLYIVYGAPTAHQNDAERAVRTGVALLSPPIELKWLHSVRVGITQGTLRTGEYGSLKRHTYSALGDEANVAARLMSEADEWQILVSSKVKKSIDQIFGWETLPAIQLKGKSEPLPVYRLVSVHEKRPVKLIEQYYDTQMVGRDAELNLMREKLSVSLNGNGQVIAVVGEAGIGKSRFVAEIVREANQRWMIGYGGACQSYGTNNSYLAWQDIWWAFFGISPVWEQHDQIEALQIQLMLIDPSLEGRLPLLSPVLGIPIPDNELTASLDKQFHKASREALLLDCLKARAQSNPLLLVIEDCQWIDPLSYDLLEFLVRGINNSPITIVLAFRPPEKGEQSVLERLQELPHATTILLNRLSGRETQKLIEDRLGQTQISRKVADIISTHADGNPFYIEELLNFLRDKGISLKDNLLERIELPGTLHSLVLSRIDQLSETEKSVLKVASVIGRTFKAAWLWELYPQAGQPNQVKEILIRLDKLGITIINVPEPELEYNFRHAVTQEVFYQILPVAQRQVLHELIATYIEVHFAHELERWLDTLTYHYERSNNEEKQREYLRKAGEVAQSNYANLSAINYYKKLLPLLEDAHEQIEIMSKLGKVYKVIGQWEEAGVFFHSALTIAEMNDDLAGVAKCRLALGDTLSDYGHFDEALEMLENARKGFEIVGMQAEIGIVLIKQGNIMRLRGDYGQAKVSLEQSLEIFRQLDDKRNMAYALFNLGSLDYYAGDYAASISYHSAALELRRELGDRYGIASSLNSIGDGAYALGNYDFALEYLSESLKDRQKMGDKWGIANTNNSLGIVAFAQGKYDIALKYYLESIEFNRQMGDKWAVANTINNMCLMAYVQGDYQQVLNLLQENLMAYRELKAKALTIEGLVTLSGVIARRTGQAKYATILAAAVEGLQESTAFSIEPVFRRVWDETVDKLKAELDPVTFEAAWLTGNNMTLEEVLELATADAYVAA